LKENKENNFLKTTSGMKYMSIVRCSCSLRAFPVLKLSQCMVFSLPQFMLLGLFLCLNLTKFDLVFAGTSIFWKWCFLCMDVC